ncbi:hypothetical protein [Azorhizobium doebereinerae]|uniref:hypothetical protein n=1 Tax=Azorhizobium doebereinerae TaxID=281091 RepID=UPI0003F4B420|nr:hypothetical protein [Azorhizobium doebereinerae]
MTDATSADASSADAITAPGLSGPIEPARAYRVALARPAAAAGVRFKPRGDLTLRGDLLVLLITENGADAVLAAEPV